MRVCWIFMILLGCRLPHAFECLNYVSENFHLETVCVAPGETVSVPCPNVTSLEISFSLLKNEENFLNLTCDFDKKPLECSSNISMGIVLHENNRSVSFNLTDVKHSSQGIYRCDTVGVYPPPYINIKGTSWILVLVEGYECNLKRRETTPIIHVAPGLGLWIWICVSAVLFIYSTGATIFAIVNYMKLKHSDSQSDYMNTKPRAPKDRKKKRGLENPIPRHF